MHVFGPGYLDLVFWPGCVTRRGAEFSRFLPLATDDGESQAVVGPCVWEHMDKFVNPVTGLA